MNWIDSELADGREFVAGAKYSMADIVLLCGIDFANSSAWRYPRAPGICAAGTRGSAHGRARGLKALFRIDLASIV